MAFEGLWRIPTRLPEDAQLSWNVTGRCFHPALVRAAYNELALAVDLTGAHPRARLPDRHLQRLRAPSAIKETKAAGRDAADRLLVEGRNVAEPPLHLSRSSINRTTSDR